VDKWCTVDIEVNFIDHSEFHELKSQNGGKSSCGASAGNHVEI
jgi:hypothetical protein